MTTLEPTTTPDVPHDAHTEAILLGAILRYPDTISRFVDRIQPWYFHQPKHRAIWDAMTALVTCNPTKPRICEFNNVWNQLKLLGKADLIGTTFVDLYDFACLPALDWLQPEHIDEYARNLTEYAQQRAVIAQSAALVQKAHEPGAAAALLAEVERMREHLASYDADTGLVAAEQMSYEWNDQTDQGGVLSLPTGLTALDFNLGGGFHPGEMIVLAARPGVGKSWLAAAITHHFAKRQRRVVFVSLEMLRGECWNRLIAIESGVGLTQVRAPLRSERGDTIRMVEANGVMGERFDVHILDRRSATMGAIRSECERLMRRDGTPIDLVVIDYLQLVNPPTTGGREANRQTEVSQISRGIKLLAGEVNCPVLALSQLNRSVEHRQDKIPVLSDLRESGSIEQDADVVLFMDREDIRDPNTQRRGITDIYIAKQRSGPLGRVSFRFDPATGRWSPEGYSSVEGY